MRHFEKPLTGLVIRGSGPNLILELQRSRLEAGFPDPDLFDHFAHSGRGLLTEENWRGTRPSQAAKSRPRQKFSISGAKASTAREVNGPTPGIVCKRRAATASCGTVAAPSSTQRAAGKHS